MFGLALLPATEAVAVFQAAELVYYPVAARNTGANNSQWFTEITITNVDNTAVDIVVFFFRTGAVDNSVTFLREFGIGPREEQGWGVVVPELADIPPGGTIELQNIVGNYFLDLYETTSLLGGLAIFAYEAGTLDSTDGEVYRNIVVQGRNHTTATIWVEDPDNEGQFVEEPTTYGHTVPGVPWYDTADPGAVDENRDLSFQVLVGGKDNNDFRYNAGFMNCSDFQTSLRVLIEARDAAGNVFLNDEELPINIVISLPPLAHLQYNRIFRDYLDIETEEPVSLIVRVLGWETTSTDPKPGLTSYGTIVDHRSNDPTYVLPTFGEPYDVDCVWQNPTDTGEGSAAAPKEGRFGPAVQRALPITIPSR
jgi:hypothetical protein